MVDVDRQSRVIVSRNVPRRGYGSSSSDPTKRIFRRPVLNRFGAGGPGGPPALWPLHVATQPGASLAPVRRVQRNGPPERISLGQSVLLEANEGLAPRAQFQQ